MRILKLDLNGYKRLSLSGITELVYTPQANIQIILGRNMSGKSQLLRQLNPLPANLKQEFTETGWKHIEIEHLGRHYYLSSTNIGHSFLVDGIELNKSGNKKDQLQLVIEHFNITPAVVDVMLGVTKFVNLSPAERKSILTDMSKIDFKYSIGIYIKLKSRHRDIVGGIKLLRDRISTNKQKILAEEDYKNIVEEITMLKKFKDHILSSKLNITTEEPAVDISTKDISNTLNKITKPSSIEALRTVIQQQDIDKVRLTTVIDNTIKSIGELEKLSKLPSVESLKQEFIRLTMANEELTLLNKYKLNLANSESLWLTWQDVYPYLVDLIDKLGEYDSVRFGRREELISQYEKLTKQLDTLAIKKKYVLEQIEHLKESETQKQIKCKQCGNSWIDNNQDKIDQLQEYIVRIDSNHDLIKPDYDKITWDVNKLNRLIELESKISNIITSLPVSIRELLEELIVPSTITVQTMLNSLQTIHINLEKLKDYSTNLNKLKHIELLLEQHKMLTLQHDKDIENNTAKLTEQLQQDTITLNKLKEEQSYNIEQLRLLEQLQTQKDYLYKNLKLHKKKYTYLLTKERNNYLLELINLLDTEIVKREQVERERDIVNKNIEVDTQQLQQLEQEESVLAKMVDALSPESGLIAKSLSSSINAIIYEMNNVINKIWTYPVELLPCDIEDSDISFKFKVRVNDGEVIEDISKLSSSLQEIVNLAFRLVYYNYHRFNNYPLYLDEFGNTFDKEHRTQAYFVIDKLLSSEFSQMFIITHYNELYGSIKNADFNVIDENNIDLSGVDNYNQHLNIVRRS